MNYTNEEINAAVRVLDALKGGNLSKGAGTSTDGQQIYQPGGLFATHGLENVVFHNVLTIKSYMDALPAFPSTTIRPFFPTITEIGAESGSEGTALCGDWPAPSVMKAATLTAAFGQLARSTDTLRITDVVGIENRGIFQDLNVVGAPLGEMGSTIPGETQNQNPLDTFWSTQMMMVGVILKRKLAPMLWSGDPANNSDDYEEFPGFEQLVVTSHVDARTNTAAAGLDSKLINANYGVVGDGYDIVELFQAFAHWADQAQQPVAGATWDVVMRPELWRRLCDVWPVQYNSQFFSALYAGDSSTRLNLDATSLASARDAMFNAKQIMVSGMTLNVVIDDAMPYETSTDDAANIGEGEISSDIYFIPRTVAGSIPATYLQYMDWSGISRESMNMFANGDRIFWSHSGRFLWGADYNESWCQRMKVLVKPRLILRTPQLAVRVYNLKARVDDMLPLRKPLTDITGGGESARSATTYYSTWK